MPNDYEKEMRRMQGEYSLYAAEQDSSALAVSKFLGDKLDPSLAGIIRDIVMVVQQLTGMQNRGVHAAMNVLGGVQNYGLPTMSASGAYSSVGGAGISSYYAANAINRELMRDFFNPLTNLPNSRAYGLDQAELGKSFNQFFKSGRQYGMGPAFDTRVVDEEYKRRMMEEAQRHFERTGDRSTLNEAQGMVVGGTHLTLRPEFKQKAKAAIEDFNATLGSIKEIMGDEALKNLEGTVQKLFGGDIAQFGERAARMRMAQIKAISAEYGGGPEGVQRAVAALGASAAVANTGNQTVDFHTAIFTDRMARAGGAAALANAGVAQGLGYYVPPSSVSQKAQTTAEQTGAIVREEEELLLAEITLQSQGGGTAEQKKRLSQARAELMGAKTEEEIANARSRLRGIALEIDPTANLEKYGGAASAMELLSPEAKLRTASGAAAMAKNRNQSYLRSTFETEARFTEMLGLSSAEAGDLGMGLANMDPAIRKSLEEIMNVKDPEARRRAVQDLRSKNPQLDASLGTNPDSFWSIINAGRITGDQARVFGGAAASYAEHKGFVPLYAQREFAEREYTNLTRENYQGKVSADDFLEDLMRGIYGDRQWNAQEKMNEIIRSGGATTSFELDKDRFKGTEANLKAIRKDLTAEEAAALEALGMPADDAAAMKWMETAEGSMAIQETLRGGGRAFTMMEGRAYTSTTEESHKAADRLSDAARLRISDETETAKRASDLIEAASFAGAKSSQVQDFNRIYGQYAEDPEAKKRFDENIQKQYDQVQASIEWTERGMRGDFEYSRDGKEWKKEDFQKNREELVRRAESLEAMGDRRLSSATSATNHKGTMNINVSGNVNINSNQKGSASS